MSKYMWAVVSDLDCDWANTKKDAVKRAKELVKRGAGYCFIEKFDDEGTTGETEYIKEEVK